MGDFNRENKTIKKKKPKRNVRNEKYSRDKFIQRWTGTQKRKESINLEIIQ